MTVNRPGSGTRRPDVSLIPRLSRHGTAGSIGARPCPATPLEGQHDLSSSEVVVVVDPHRPRAAEKKDDKSDDGKRTTTTTTTTIQKTERKSRIPTPRRSNAQVARRRSDSPSRLKTSSSPSSSRRPTARRESKDDSPLRSRSSRRRLEDDSSQRIVAASGRSSRRDSAERIVRSGSREPLGKQQQQRTGNSTPHSPQQVQQEPRRRCFVSKATASTLRSSTMSSKPIWRPSFQRKSFSISVPNVAAKMAKATPFKRLADDGSTENESAAKTKREKKSIFNRNVLHNQMKGESKGESKGKSKVESKGKSKGETTSKGEKGSNHLSSINGIHNGDVRHSIQQENQLHQPQQLHQQLQPNEMEKLVKESDSLWRRAEELDAKIEQLTAQLQLQTEQLQEKDTLLAKQASQLQETNKNISCLTNKFENTEAKLIDRTTQLELAESRLQKAKVSKTRAIKEATLATASSLLLGMLLRRVAMRARETKRSDAEAIKKSEVEMRKKDERLVDLEREAIELREEVKVKDLHLDEAFHMIDDKNDLLKQMEEKIKERDRSLDDAASKIQDRDDQVERFQIEVADKNEQLQRLEDDLLDKNQHIFDLEEEIGINEAEMGKCVIDLDRILGQIMTEQGKNLQIRRDLELEKREGALVRRQVDLLRNELAEAHCREAMRKDGEESKDERLKMVEAELKESNEKCEIICHRLQALLYEKSLLETKFVGLGIVCNYYFKESNYFKCKNCFQKGRKDVATQSPPPEDHFNTSNTSSSSVCTAGSRCHLTQEVESLNFVLSLKNGEVREQRSRIEALQAKAEKAAAEISSASVNVEKSNQQLEEARSQLNDKIEKERSMQRELQQLRKKLKRESEEKLRLSRRNEELDFKLRNSTFSFESLSSEEEKHSRSLSSPGGSAAAGDDIASSRRFSEDAGRRSTPRRRRLRTLSLTSTPREGAERTPRGRREDAEKFVDESLDLDESSIETWGDSPRDSSRSSSRYSSSTTVFEDDNCDHNHIDHNHIDHNRRPSIKSSEEINNNNNAERSYDESRPTANDADWISDDRPSSSRRKTFSWEIEMK